jgi:mannose-6-phosphate isomerase
MWYVLAAAPGAFIYYGFKRKITADEFEARIKNETLLGVLKKVRLKKGDVFMIPAGTLHAIGKGLLILEVQQNCDLTYRVYDYGRRDKNGCQRELHLEKALDVTTLGPARRQPHSPIIPLSQRNDIETLVTYKDFIVKRVNVCGQLQLLSLPDTYQVLFVAEGSFKLLYETKTYDLNWAETIFLPAGLGDYHLQGEGEIIMVTDN